MTAILREREDIVARIKKRFLRRVVLEMGLKNCVHRILPGREREDVLDRGNKCEPWKGMREAESKGEVIMETRLEEHHVSTHHASFGVARRP